MNRKNCSLVKGPQGVTKYLMCFCPIHRLSQKARQEFVSSLARREGSLSFANSYSNTPLQVLGGRVRKSHHENLAHRELSFQKQPHVKGSDGVCLTSSRAGFNQFASSQADIDKIERRHCL